MKTAKDLKIPFSWAERKPILLERFFYVPTHYAYEPEVIPFFETEAPVVIEYCSGNGQWIGDRAVQNPNVNWLAVEKRFERARQIWLRIQREGITNLSVVCGEALVFTKYYAPKTKEAYVNFPDPWPKLRHAKHRLVRHEFLEELSKIMDVGGMITCTTDDANYAAEMRSEFAKCAGWEPLFFGHDWPGYGKSYFNDLWCQKGRIINYLSYEKKA